MPGWERRRYLGSNRLFGGSTPSPWRREKTRSDKITCCRAVDRWTGVYGGIIEVSSPSHRVITIHQKRHNLLRSCTLSFSYYDIAIHQELHDLLRSCTLSSSYYGIPTHQERHGLLRSCTPSLPKIHSSRPQSKLCSKTSSNYDSRPTKHSYFLLPHCTPPSPEEPNVVPR